MPKPISTILLRAKALRDLEKPLPYSFQMRYCPKCDLTLSYPSHRVRCKFCKTKLENAGPR